jgi:hypothetical protein
MPIEDTPPEQVLAVAVAANATGDPTVLPLVGLLIETAANTGAVNAKSVRMMQGKFFFINLPRHVSIACMFEG